jgi:spore coat protein A, manganese oxidase
MHVPPAHREESTMRRPWSRAIGAGLAATLGALVAPNAFAQLSDPTLDPQEIPKYEDPLVIPPVMPSVRANHYEIAVRQFEQRILPSSMSLPPTTVWGYGSVTHPGTVAEGGTFNYPAFTLEARWSVPVRVKWINDLVDANGEYLPHLLPVDRTLHWANPELLPCTDGAAHTDCRPEATVGSMLQAPYDGPVPMVTHVHGAETFDDSDGYPEAWYLPSATNVPAGYARTGKLYRTFERASPLGSSWEPGAAVFRYPNRQRAATLWYHDHTLGMTRLNVYAGPAGFYLLRGGPHGDGFVDDGATRRRRDGVLPGPAPTPGQAAAALNTPGDPVRSSIREIPIVIQDRSFNADGSLFYPDSRTFFDGFTGPFFPDEVDLASILGMSDVSPIWNPEFFGNAIVVNGRTWPKLEVAQALYRFRFLNGSGSRFLILQLGDAGDVPAWQIGAEGGFLPAPVNLGEDVQPPLGPGQMLVGPAERADVIVDFRGAAHGAEIVLLNVGPDEPFGGGAPGVDFEPADPLTTGQVMKFVVNDALNGASPTDPTGATPATDPEHLVLPQRTPYGPATRVQYVSLNEEMSRFAEHDPAFDVPVAALLGTVDPDTMEPTSLTWQDGITEEPRAGTTEVWEIWNFTEDAHPIHIHVVQFEVLGRAVQGDPAAISVAGTNGPLPWERGTKDTVIAYPGEITRVKAHFPFPGLFVWHCHILEHEDNEMMRPFCIQNVTGRRPNACEVADGAGGAATPR